MIPTNSAALADAFFLGSANERIVAVKPNHEGLSVTFPDMERAGTTTIGGMGSGAFGSTYRRQDLAGPAPYGIFGLGELSGTTKTLLVVGALVGGWMLLRKRH